MLMHSSDKRVLIEVVRGDIAEQDTTAIVNAANNHFWMGSGVAGAIKRKGGQVIEDEAIALGPIDVGQAVCTSGGSLTARYVIHAAVMGQDLQTDATKIRWATRNSLQIAEKRSTPSLSFPALGTGVGGFPVDECARIMVDEVRSHLKAATHLKLVRFVVFDEESLRVFRHEIARHARADR
jgi:O-acetyl-ADP-ribose deacetylase (regulator of RNase III)